MYDRIQELEAKIADLTPPPPANDNTSARGAVGGVSFAQIQQDAAGYAISAQSWKNKPKTPSQRLIDVYRELLELGVDRYHVATIAETAAYEAANILATVVAPMLVAKKAA